MLPIGTTWRLDPDEGSEQRILYLEAPSEIEPPKRYRNDYGQLLEHSPYSQRDLHAPEFREPIDEHGDFVIDVRSTDRITAYHYRHHPFDAVGWDGYLWPFRFDIADFQPITGRVHQPPPVHQTFQARNFVVCSFVPRKFDYHPLAIPAPYNHSNINSDEVIYYVAGNFMSRRGVAISSFTLHPAGIPHGPHPGTAEASIGKEATEELAVMVDTFHPLHVTQAAMDLDDDRTTRSPGCRRRTPSSTLASSASAARRHSRTDLGRQPPLRTPSRVSSAAVGSTVDRYWMFGRVARRTGEARLGSLRLLDLDAGRAELADRVARRQLGRERVPEVERAVDHERVGFEQLRHDPRGGGLGLVHHSSRERRPQGYLVRPVERDQATA